MMSLESYDSEDDFGDSSDTQGAGEKKPLLLEGRGTGGAAGSHNGVPRKGEAAGRTANGTSSYRLTNMAAGSGTYPPHPPMADHL